MYVTIGLSATCFLIQLLLICKCNWLAFITMGRRKALTMKSEQMKNVTIKVLLLLPDLRQTEEDGWIRQMLINLKLLA